HHRGGAGLPAACLPAPQHELRDERKTLTSTTTTLFGMDIWPPQRELSLARTPPSNVEATALAGRRTWLKLGTDSTGLWGACAGGRGQRYQTVVDLGPPPAYTCSCPSRKVPCKHALALLLQWSDVLVPAGQPPPFAAGWLDERALRKTQPEPASTSRQ